MGLVRRPADVLAAANLNAGRAPTKRMPTGATLVERFWAKVAKRGRDECWPWIAGSRGNGYGAIKAGEKIVDAHVVTYELAHKTQLLPGLCVTHTCDNRACCNPRHLVAGTKADNYDDMTKRGTSGLRPAPKPPHVPGEKHGAAKLTWASVREMRSLAAGGATHTELAERFDVSRAQARRIVLGERWKESA